MSVILVPTEEQARKRVPAPELAEVRENLRNALLSHGVAQVVQHAMTNARIERFNVNGTSTGRASPEPQDSRGN